MQRLGYSMPLGILAVLAVYFLLGLGRDPYILPSALINTPVAAFDLPAIEGEIKGFSNSDLKGRVSLVNVFGSWCAACQEEHGFLMELSRQNIIPVYGIDWRAADRRLARMAETPCNPYTLVGDDPKSLGAIAFGVTGAPSFLTDKDGVIRFKHTGPITHEIWTKKFSPIISELRK